MKAFAFGLAVVLASTCHAQTKSAVSAPSSKEVLSELQRSMPSEKEFSELLAKAEEKVSAFEAAVKNSKPLLDKIDTKFATQYLDAAATAHESISQTLKNGPSAYSLVSVLTMLNDLSRQAANGAVLLLGADEFQGKPLSTATRLAVFALNTAGTACNDIAAQILDATMRLIAAEETALNKLLNNQK